MKYLILLLTLVCTSTAYANDLPQIQVTGVARQSFLPDELRWQLHVKNTGKIVSEVADKHAEYVKTVLSYLHKKNVPEKNIRTSHMQLQENWVYRGDSRVLEGYFASTTVSFTSQDFNEYTAIWKTLSSFDKVQIDAVNFALSNSDQLQQELQVQALHNARAQAKRMAEALGSALGEPLFIGEQLPFPPPGERGVALMAHNDSEEHAIAPGEVVVTATALVTFRLLTP